MEQHPICQYFDEDGQKCRKHAVDIHHKAGRGAFLNDTDTWMSICREHHDLVHQNPHKAKQLGHMLNAASLLKQKQNNGN